MNPKVVLVVLFLAMFISQAFTWGYGWGRRLQRRSSSSSGSSPAGGPSSNPSAVVCTSYRSSNRLTCKQSWWYKVRCTTQPPSQPRDDRPNGPTPRGEYLIGKRYTHPLHRIDWYNLYPKKQDNSGYYNYSQPTEKGRFAMGLHPGNVSEGCVTVKKQTCWNRVRWIVDRSNMYYKGSAYSGFLYVK